MLVYGPAELVADAVTKRRTDAVTMQKHPLIAQVNEGKMFQFDAETGKHIGLLGPIRSAQ